MPHSLKTSRIGFQRSAMSLNPASIIASETGGNEYSRCQIDEPVKPLTTLTPSLCGRSGRVHHLLGGPLPDSLGLAVAPDVVGQNQLVPLIDQVANRLPDQVVGDCPDFQPILAQKVVASLAVVLVGERLLDIEVIAPAGQFDALVTPFAGLLADDFEGQVGPLAGEKGHGT